MCSGSMRKWPRRASGAADEPRALRPAAEAIARPGSAAGQRRRVVDLEPQLRNAAGVAQRVGHAQPVPDVAVELAHRVSRLEIGQAEPGQNV